MGSTTTGALLKVDNNGSGTALDLRVGPPTADPAAKTVAPMKVDSQVEVANLNAALAGRADSATSADFAANAQNAANADMLGGKDIDELPGSVVQAVNITEQGSPVPFGSFTFVAPPVTVTTSPTQRSSAWSQHPSNAILAAPVR